MITLIGHGYIGKAINKELTTKRIPFKWVSHVDFHPGMTDGKGIVINAAGYVGVPNVDACETNKGACIAGNVEWPLRCERFSKDPVIHIGSGCIYSGSHHFSEEDPPNFTLETGSSFYSGCKAISDKLLSYSQRSYVLRIRMPFSGYYDTKNLFSKLEKYPKLIDAENSISRVEDVANVAIWFAARRPTPGLYNVVNPGFVTTKMIARALKLENKEWFTEEEFKAAVTAPRSVCTLSSVKLMSIFPIPTAERALSEAAQQYLKSTDGKKPVISKEDVARENEKPTA